MQIEPLRLNVFADELHPLFAYRRGTGRRESLVASRTRPHNLQQLYVLCFGPVSETRLGLPLLTSTQLLSVQAVTDLDACARRRA